MKEKKKKILLHKTEIIPAFRGSRECDYFSSLMTGNLCSFYTTEIGGGNSTMLTYHQLLLKIWHGKGG